MGRGRRYSPHENQMVAKAFAWATNDDIKGADQKFTDFMGRVLTYLKTHKPVNAQEGMYDERGVEALTRYVAEMKKDVQKFMSALRMVLLTQMSGTTDQDHINMAVAIHLKVTNKPEYARRIQDPNAWANFPAFLVLRSLPQFQVPTISPSASRSIASSEVEESKDTENTTSPECKIADDFCNTDSGMKRTASRGGSGVKKAKLAEVENKKTERKLKQLAELNETMKALVEETKTARLAREADRQLTELVTLLDHTPAEKSGDLLEYLNQRVRSNIGLPTPVPDQVGKESASVDSSIGY